MATKSITNIKLRDELMERIDRLEVEISKRDTIIQTELEAIFRALNGSDKESIQEEEKPSQNASNVIEQITLDGKTEWEETPWLPNIRETSGQCYLEITPEWESDKAGLLYFRVRKYNKDLLPGQQWEFIGERHFLASKADEDMHKDFNAARLLVNYDGTYEIGDYGGNLALRNDGVIWLIGGNILKDVIINGESSVVLADSDFAKISLLLSHRGEVYLRYETPIDIWYEELYNTPGF